MKIEIKKQSIIGACDAVVRVSMYTLVFLVPIFFLPWSQDALEFNKQTLLVAFVFISLLAWILRILISGSVTLNINKVHVAMGVLFLAYAASTIFSVSAYGSFWGWPSVTSDSLLSMTCFAVVYFLISNTFSQKEVGFSFALLLISSVLVELYGILQIAGLHILPLGIAKSNAFNTIGSIGNFALFVSVLLPLCILFSLHTKKWIKVISIINIVLIGIALLFINYYFIWWVIALGCAWVILFWIIKKDTIHTKWIFLPTFFLVIAIFFIVFNPQIAWFFQKPLEISLSERANLGVDIATFRSSPILGSGPGTFAYDLSKYKEKETNTSSLWNVSFDSGSSQFLTRWATLGLLGLLSLVSVILLTVFYATRYLIAKKVHHDVHHIALVLGILSIVVAQTLGGFFYNFNISLDFLYFFCVASLVALIFKDKKTYPLASHSFLAIAMTFVFAFILIFGFGMVLLEKERYVANAYYFKGLTLFNQDNKDEGIKYLKLAISHDANTDLYFRQLAVFSSLKLQVQTTAGKSVTSEDKAIIQALVFDSINAANKAVALGPNNVDNWSAKGYVCQNLTGLIEDAKSCAIQSYEKAIALNPSNPYLFVQEGNVYLVEFINLPSNQTKSKEQALLYAKNKYQKAIDLKENYSLAYFQMALAQRLAHNTNSEITALENAEKHSQNDADLLFQIGLIHYQDKRFAQAQEKFQKALSIVPDYSNALYYSGLTYSEQGQKEKSIAQFSKLLQLNPGNQNIQRIINNVKAGRVPLDGLVQSSASNAPLVTPLSDSTKPVSP